LVNAFQDPPGFLPGRRVCGDGEYLRNLNRGSSQHQTESPGAVFHSLRGPVPRHAALSSRDVRRHRSSDDPYHDDHYNDYSADDHHDSSPDNVDLDDDHHHDRAADHHHDHDSTFSEVRDQNHSWQLRLALYQLDDPARAVAGRNEQRRLTRRPHALSVRAQSDHNRTDGWHDLADAHERHRRPQGGTPIFHTLANTGVSSAPTESGTYPVYLRFTVTTMSGTYPDGSTYSDPGIPWVSYFHGGDALHGFIRSSYGFPQSLGCVEMPFADAAVLWPRTPIGTLVSVQ
jgi:hypothetical protein